MEETRDELFDRVRSMVEYNFFEQKKNLLQEELNQQQQQLRLLHQQSKQQALRGAIADPNSKLVQ